MEAQVSSKLAVPVYQSTLIHIPEDCNLNKFTFLYFSYKPELSDLFIFGLFGA
jgi:hypothetical protein